jgi:hypothetical protein
MSRDEAHKLAVEIFLHEHVRWVQNALVLLGTLVSIFAFHEGASIFPLWAVWLLAAAISITALVVIMSMRASADAWRDTILIVETHGSSSNFQLFHLFKHHMDKWSYCCDLWKTLTIWEKKSLFSVTRAYARLAIFASLVFLYQFAVTKWPHLRGCLHALFSNL